jgi:hypothetical protein
MFNYVKAQISVLVPFRTWSAFLIFFKLKIKIISIFFFVSFGCISFVSICSSRVFHKLSFVAERCFTRINTCLCELIWCAGEEPFGLNGQISTVKNPQPLIAVNHNSDKSNSTIVHVRMCCGFVCVAADLFNSVFSVHTLVSVTFYFLIFICDNYNGFVEMMNVNKVRFVSVMWVMVTCTETFVNAAGFTLPICL